MRGRYFPDYRGADASEKEHLEAMEEAFEVVSDLLAQYELHGVAPSETTAWVDWDPDDEIAVLDLGVPRAGSGGWTLLVEVRRWSDEEPTTDVRTTLLRGYAGDGDLSAAIRIVDDFSGDLQSPARGQEWPGFSLFEALVSQPLQVNETWFGTRFAGAQVLSALTGKEIARRKTFWLLPLFSLWHRNEVHSLSFLE